MLLEAHSRAIASTLLACGIDETATAEDLTQEISLRVWQALDSLQEPRAFASWLRRITANTAMDYHRSARPPAASLELAEELANEDSPHTDLVRSLELGRKVEAFRSLDPESQALLLAQAEGQRATELATDMGLTPEAVRMRLMRARKRLRDRIRELDKQG